MAPFHVVSDSKGTVPRLRIFQIGIIDVLECLRLGWRDFRAKPSHLVFLSLLYPVAGMVIFVWSAGANLLPLLFPLASGFALLGPVAALGLYEISRQREMGLAPSWRLALGVFRSPAMYSIAAASLVLLVLFLSWLKVAQLIHDWHFGPEAHASTGAFVRSVLLTAEGWSMVIIGNLAGLGFAVIVLALSVVTFPLLLDRDVGLLAAITTSIRVTTANPVPVLFWGFIVAALLVLGCLPLFAGLAVVLPVLGHATWHLYRMLVAPPELPHEQQSPSIASTSE